MVDLALPLRYRLSIRCEGMTILIEVTRVHESKCRNLLYNQAKCTPHDSPGNGAHPSTTTFYLVETHIVQTMQPLKGYHS